MLAAFSPTLQGPTMNETPRPLPDNPYSPPVSDVEPTSATFAGGTFNQVGRTVPSGHATDWIAQAWKVYSSHFGTWLGISAIFLVISAAVICIPAGNQVIVCIMSGGFLIACQRMNDTGRIEIGDVFAGFQTSGGQLALTGLIQAGIYYVFFIPGYILNLAGTLANIPVGAKLLCLGIYTLLTITATVALKLTIFAPALVIFHGMQPWEAIKTSAAAWKKNPGAFLLFMLLAHLMMAGGLVLCLIGIFFVLPLYMIGCYRAYRDIFWQPAENNF